MAGTEQRADAIYARSLAIAESAHDLAREPTSTGDEVAYTHEGEGWLWESCKRGEGFALWYCEAMA